MQGTTHLNLNSGFFYLKANERTISLMERIAARLAKEKAWDQVGRVIFACDPPCCQRIVFPGAEASVF